jgi:PAS domain S-box-containing protein
MKHDRKTALQRKLIRISMVTSLMALMLASAAFVTTDYINFRRNMETSLRSLAMVVGRNSQAALLFDDRQAARETLSALGAVPNVISGVILDLGLKPFAYFSRSGSAVKNPFSVKTPPSAGFLFHDGLAIVVQPIQLNKEFLGWVYLTADLRELKVHLGTYGLICALILLGTAALAFLLANQLQRRISNPILQLVDTMKAVSRRQDYAMRHKERRDDEIGTLIDGFNAMLDQLQSRDRDLRLTQFAMDTYSDAAYFINVEGQIIYANHAACDTLGYDPEELRRMTIGEIDPDLTPENRKKRWQELKENGSLQFEAWNQRKNGERYPVEVSNNLLVFEGHEYNCTFSRDITKRKRMAEQLQQAKRMETLGNLAAGVAHDLNNILSGLVSYPELLLLEISPEAPLYGPLKTIQKSGQKAADIVEDLLTLSRRGVAVTEVVDLNALIDDYLRSPELAKLKRHHTTVTIRTDLAASLMNLKGSTIHISKSIMNLVSNAAEAMPSGGVLRIETRNHYLEAGGQGPEGEYVHLKVQDTGVGISDEDRERIFEPFFTKKKMGNSGTGLGMSVVWATVQDHRGHIEVTSKEGRGTQFDLYFPATREAFEEPHDRFVLEEFQGRESILVVDDVEEQRMIASQMLTKLGFQVETAESGEAAIARLGQDSFDLVILDMIMSPGMDGLDTYERMLTIAPGQAAIIASGFSESERVHRMQQMGAGAYLKKPYTMENLARTVRGALRPEL